MKINFLAKTNNVNTASYRMWVHDINLLINKTTEKYNTQSKIVNDVIDIGKAISFSGFITVPLVLFLQHNLIRTINLKDSVSYSIVLFAWVMSSQIFL